jgi:hypothetical protein
MLSTLKTVFDLTLCAGVIAAITTTGDSQRAFAQPYAQASYDNVRKHYVLPSLPSAADEAKRMDSDPISDAHATGLFARKGEKLTVRVSGLKPSFSLSARIGFPPLWGEHNAQQVVSLSNGSRTITASNLGPLTFSHNGALGGATVTVDVRGASAMPLFVDGTTTLANWQAQIRKLKSAPFVSLMSRRAMITISMPTYRKSPIADPARSMAMIEKVINWQDELAGFDGSAPVHQPTPLRIHYIEDIYAMPAERENFYMYANGIVGMLDDNVADLTDPEKLSKLWGIWHETGHLKQQYGWTWSALTEINVNLFSLYVQEKFGHPSRLLDSEDKGSPSTLAMAKDYLAGKPDNYLEDSKRDNAVFVRLVMFHQLKQAYGWDVFKRLHKAMRERPGPSDASDQEKADRFISAMCKASSNNLIPFFAQWGLHPSPIADARKGCTKYQMPTTEISKIEFRASGLASN